MGKQNNIPKLRFPEFVDTWKNEILSNISDIYDGTHQTPNYVDTGVKFVSVENIDDIQNTDKFITKAAFEKDFKNKPRKDDILMTRITAGIIGSTSIVQNNDPLGYYVSLALIRKKTGIDVKFLNQAINSHYFKHELHKRIIHVAFPKKINLGDIGDCNLSIPSFPEQTKIATFLTAVDDRLNQLKKKKTLLEQYKKGVMQKIFDQELRFKDDEGNEYPDWDENTLGNYLVKHVEKTTENNQYPVLTSSRKGLFFQKDYFDGNDVASKDNTGYNVVPRNYFTYRHMSDDVTFKFNINSLCDKGIVSTLYPVFTTQNINDDFLQLKLNEGAEFIKYAIEQKQGGSRTYMYFNKLELLLIFLPSIAEQTKIVNFISAIDEKIMCCTNQISKTEQYKKGLLQQMFV